MSKVTGTWYRDKARELREVTLEIQMIHPEGRKRRRDKQTDLAINIIKATVIIRDAIVRNVNPLPAFQPKGLSVGMIEPIFNKEDVLKIGKAIELLQNMKKIN